MVTEYLSCRRFSGHLAATGIDGEKLETDEELLPSYIPIVKSSSENKVYEIGNKYKPAPGDMITLTGRVSDFKTGQNLDGINIIHREPWVATTTNRQGNLPLTCLQAIIFLKSVG